MPNYQGLIGVSGEVSLENGKCGNQLIRPYILPLKCHKASFKTITFSLTLKFCQTANILED
jgi:hypothetical protein